MFPSPAVRLTALTATAILAASVVTAVGAQAAAPLAARDAGPRSAAADTSESAQAARLGHRVAVDAKTTETAMTWANPDGSFTSDFSVEPVRVRRGTGWTPVDTNLVVGPDGRVVPKATGMSIALSNGGAGTALATLARDGKSFAMSWPGTLPAPALAANVATYAEVLPGVDLKVTVEPEGFSEVLVVKSLVATANPALKHLRLTTKAVGGTGHGTPDGGLAVVDDGGASIFSAGQPLMWDSSSGASTGIVSAAGAQAGGHLAQGPKEGSRVAKVPMSVASDALTLTPDAAFLTATTTTYPVMIDPAVFYSAGKTGWAMVNASYPTQAYWKWTAADEGLGYTTSQGVHKKRLFYMFGTSAINSKILRAATLKSFETWSYSCTASAVQAWETNAVYSSTTWNAQPTWKAQLDSATAAYGRDGCTPGGAWVSFNVLAAVQHSQTAGGYNTTLGLKASSETAESGWKRFRNDATLSIEYNTKPAMPTSLKTTWPSTSCVTGTARPFLPRVDPPILNATINDADGVKGQTVEGKFEVWNLAHTTMVHSFYTPFKLPGGVYTDTVPTLADGSYAWRVFGYDNMNYSVWSQWCEFSVDGTRPLQPSVTSVPTTGYCTADAGVGDANDHAACAVGQSSRFRVTPPDSGVTKYKWAVNATTPTSAFVAITTPDFTVPHTSFGPETVRVWTYDAAGNISTGPGELEYRVSGSARSGWWRMDDAGSTLADASGRNRPMTSVGGYTRVAGKQAPPAGEESNPFYDPTDFALKFNGSTGQASTAGPVITMGSGYTISAWVRLDAPVTARGIIASQDRGTGATAPWTAALFADPPSTLDSADPNSCECPGGRLGFTTYDGTKTATNLFSDQMLVPGKWTHVIGVYSPGGPTMTLYVDGELAGSSGDSATADQTSATPTGPFRVGHLNGYTSGWFPGVIDEVGTFDGAYDDAQADRLFRTARPSAAP